MSYKGTPITTVRIATELMQRIEAQIESLRLHSPRGDWSVTEFIRKALEEKLAKMRRSRTKKRYRSALVSMIPPAQIAGGMELAATGKPLTSSPELPGREP